MENFVIKPEQIKQLEAFLDALYLANETRNLTRVPREEAWERHILDSIAFIDLLQYDARILDIGTGPGFPAWPIACVRQDLRVTALDSNHKMLSFLAEHPLPNLEVINARAEEWDRREYFDIVTGRAVAPLPIQLEVSAPFLKKRGFILAMRTPAEAETFDHPNYIEVGVQFTECVEREVAGVLRSYPMYHKVKKTPDAYPRKWAHIKARPLAPIASTLREALEQEEAEGQALAD